MFRVLGLCAFGLLAPVGLAAVNDTEPADAASPVRVRLISQEQYFNSLAYLFGPDIAVAAHFAPFRRTDGLFAIGSASAGVTLGQMQEFQRTAGAIADQVVSAEHRHFAPLCELVRRGEPGLQRLRVLHAGCRAAGLWQLRDHERAGGREGPLRFVERTRLRS